MSVTGNLNFSHSFFRLIGTSLQVFRGREREFSSFCHRFVAMVGRLDDRWPKITSDLELLKCNITYKGLYGSFSGQ